MELIAFLTDYGSRDGFVAVCHGVLARRAPGVRVLDVSHDVPAYDVRHGARVLARVAPHLPPAVHVAVVDPGVGTSRRGVALRAGDALLVGPDNGLLPPAADALGGVDAAYALTNPALWLPDLDETFHGRDIFAPVGAHLAAGGALEEVGEPLDPAELIRLASLGVEIGDGVVGCQVGYVDGFGNAQLSARPRDLEAAGLGAAETITVRWDESEEGCVHAAYVATFGAVPTGSPLLHADSDRMLSLSINEGHAARRYGLAAASPIRLSASR